MSKGLWRQRRKRHNTARANAFRMEWAVARLRATLLGNVVRRRLVCAWVCVWHSVIGRATAPPSDVSPTSADSVVEEEEVTHDLRPSTAGSRKRTRWQEHFPWPFVTPQALNARGEHMGCSSAWVAAAHRLQHGLLQHMARTHTNTLTLNRSDR